MNAIIAIILLLWFLGALLFCLALCAAAAGPAPPPTRARDRRSRRASGLLRDETQNEGEDDVTGRCKVETQYATLSRLAFHSASTDCASARSICSDAIRREPIDLANS